MIFRFDPIPTRDIPIPAAVRQRNKATIASETDVIEVLDLEDGESAVWVVTAASHPEVCIARFPTGVVYIACESPI